MSRNYQIIVVSDDDERSRDLRIILQFLGEPVIVMPPAELQQRLTTPQDILAIIIGKIDQPHQEHEILKQLATIKTGLSVVKLGADEKEILSKIFVENILYPIKSAQLADVLRRCQIRRENAVGPTEKEQRPIPLFRSLVGTSPAIQSVRHLIEQVLDSDISVLIFGESGTGKEVVARNLHYVSGRKDKSFVPVNCGAIPAELLESELFGHEKGSFTGAIANRQGRFELANGGTLFLDEIGDMPLPMQVKLLRVLEDHNFQRVGSNKSITSEVRIIAATHRNLDDEIKQGRFREDLYYRLNVFPITVPPLRQRIEDFPLLIDELLSRIASEGRPVFHITPNAIAALCQYNWPGNIRELANLIERLAILYPDKPVDVQDLPQKFADVDNHQRATAITLSPQANANQPLLPHDGINLKEHLSNLELSLIQQALTKTNGVVAKAAKFLNMRRTTLVEKMRKYGISRDISGSRDATSCVSQQQ